MGKFCREHARAYGDDVQEACSDVESGLQAMLAGGRAWPEQAVAKAKGRGKGPRSAGQKFI